MDEKLWSPSREKWLGHLREAAAAGALVKVTLSAPDGADKSLQNIFVRPVTLRAGPRLSFVYRHTTRDITKNLPVEEGVALIATLVGTDFLVANLFYSNQTAELTLRAGKAARLSIRKNPSAAPVTAAHDRAKERPIHVMAPWLHALGVTTAEGRVREGMAAKYRQINRFVEILSHLLAGAAPQDSRPHSPPFAVADMGCGKGYLTFATYDYLRSAGWPEAQVRGIETRPDLVEQCNGIARENHWADLQFETGAIADVKLERVDLLLALHACDTATDDALAKGVQAGASWIIAAPCCHKELRPQLQPPAVLAGALKHGILKERQAEFVTDALRAALLEWAGYETSVFEFIATEHTAKNLMIAATKRPGIFRTEESARRVRELAAFYGIKQQRLAAQLGFVW